MIAVIFGFLVYRRNMPVGISTVCGIGAIALIIVIGINFHPVYLSETAWMWILGIYIAVASVTPVWILLQPRDYLSSFLLYGMLILAVIGVIVAHPSMSSLPVIRSEECTTPVFPVLFTTIACGACSGFHSLVSSGTTSKQLNKEKDAKPIAYGGMLLECVLAVLTLCAVAFAYKVNADSAAAGGEAVFSGATSIFGGGIAAMIAGETSGTLYSVLRTLLMLTYSTFCVTSLDTTTRLARFTFQEFWIDSTKGETVENVKGVKKFLVNPYVATVITAVFGIMLGLHGYEKIWAIFGSANQLLAALGLLAIAAWLGNAGRKNLMVVIPMFFMLCVTIASLFINTKTQIGLIAAGGADWGPYVQAILGILLVILAIILAIEGIITLYNGKKKNKAAADGQ